MNKSKKTEKATVGLNDMVVEMTRERMSCPTEVGGGFVENDKKETLTWDNLSFEFYPRCDTPGTTKVSINTVSKKEVVELANALIRLSEGFIN